MLMVMIIMVMMTTMVLNAIVSTLKTDQWGDNTFQYDTYLLIFFGSAKIANSSGSRSMAEKVIAFTL